MFLISQDTTIVGVAPTGGVVVDWCRANCKKKAPLMAFRHNRRMEKVCRYDGAENFVEVIANPDGYTFVLDDGAYYVQRIDYIG